jgi:predicted enzyme related to lactoylglutathione lyase
MAVFPHQKGENTMSIGCFSVSLSVKDIQASMTFYQTFGFEIFHDSSDQGWCILKNGDAVIGLFQGMFEGNLLTFNPGWDQNANPQTEFEDIRSLQARLQAAGVAIDTPTEPDGQGPAQMMLKDPDGNAILVDQHVSAP